MINCKIARRKEVTILAKSIERDMQARRAVVLPARRKAYNWISRDVKPCK